MVGRILPIDVHGQGSHKYDNVRIGLNARLDTIQAAILRVKLRYLANEIRRRSEVASAYSDAIAPYVTVPHVPPDRRSAWAQYSILSDDRNGLSEHLKQSGVPSAVYYQTPLPLLKAYEPLGYAPGDFAVAERISRQVLSLPMHPYLSAEQLARISQAVAEWASKTPRRAAS